MKKSAKPRPHSNISPSCEISVGIQQDVIDTIALLRPSSRAVFITAVVSAFVSGSNSNSLYVASVPQRGKILPVTMTMDRCIHKQWTRIAKQISGGRLSRLVQAAMHQHFPL